MASLVAPREPGFGSPVRLKTEQENNLRSPPTASPDNPQKLRAPNSLADDPDTLRRASASVEATMMPRRPDFEGKSDAGQGRRCGIHRQPEIRRSEPVKRNRHARLSAAEVRTRQEANFPRAGRDPQRRKPVGPRLTPDGSLELAKPTRSSLAYRSAKASPSPAIVGVGKLPSRDHAYTPPITPQRRAGAADYISTFGPFSAAYLERLTGDGLIIEELESSEPALVVDGLQMFYNRAVELHFPPLIRLIPRIPEGLPTGARELTTVERSAFGFGRLVYDADACLATYKFYADVTRNTANFDSSSTEAVAELQKHAEGLKKLDQKLDRHPVISPFGTCRLRSAADAAAHWGMFYSYMSTVAPPGPLAAEFALAAGVLAELTAFSRSAAGFGRRVYDADADFLGFKFYADITRNTANFDSSSTEAVVELQKHTAGLKKLDEKISAAKESATAMNAERDAALAKFFEEQAAGLAGEPDEAAIAAAKENIEEMEEYGEEEGKKPEAAEVAAKNQVEALAAVTQGVGQERALLARAEARHSDMNAAAFPFKVWDRTKGELVTIATGLAGELDERITAAKEITSRKNAERSLALTKYLEEQTAVLSGEPDAAAIAVAKEEIESEMDDEDSSPATPPEAPDAAEWAAKNQAETLATIQQGVSQELALLARAEARKADANVAAFPGIDWTLLGAAKVLRESAFDAGEKEWGFENAPLPAASDVNDSAFPYKCVIPKDELKAVEQQCSMTVADQLKELEAGTSVQAVSPEDLRLSDKGEEPLDHELPEEGAWTTFALIFTPLSEAEQEATDHVFDRVSGEYGQVWDFTTPTELSQLVCPTVLGLPKADLKSLKLKRGNQNGLASWMGATLEEGVAWACTTAASPLSEAEAKFAETGYLTSLRVLDKGEEPLNCELAEGQLAWRAAMDELIIVEDICTEQQLATVAAREARGKVDGVARSAKLTDYFRTRYNHAPNAEFLVERLAPSEKNLPAIIAAHKEARAAVNAAEEAAPQILIAGVLETEAAAMPTAEKLRGCFEHMHARLQKKGPTKSWLGKGRETSRFELGELKTEATDLRYPHPSFLQSNWPLPERSAEEDAAAEAARQASARQELATHCQEVLVTTAAAEGTVEAAVRVAMENEQLKTQQEVPVRLEAASLEALVSLEAVSLEVLVSLEAPAPAPKGTLKVRQVVSTTTAPAPVKAAAPAPAPASAKALAAPAKKGGRGCCGGRPA